MHERELYNSHDAGNVEKENREGEREREMYKHRFHLSRQ